MFISGGPRLCIGQRFAQIEMKIALAKIVAKYRLISTKETELKFLRGDPFLLSFQEFQIMFQSRK